jgi:hypothetical protein
MTVCIGCGEILEFDRKMRLKKITLARLIGLEAEYGAKLRETQRHVRRFLAENPR